MDRKNRTAYYLKIVFWMIVNLILIDLAINLLFHHPTDPHARPSRLQDYFEYGRSVEGKLDRMTRPDADASSPRVRGGWLNSDKFKGLPDKASKRDNILIALYGMSHTQELWWAIQKIDSRFDIRGFMAAGAAPNWSYAAYEMDRGRHKADVVVLGILTDSITPITATTGMTAFFDSSFPYTFPRYTVKNDILFSAYPPFYDAKGYIEHFYNQRKWKSFRVWLSENDKYYDPFLFRRSILDHSALFRLMRRAYAEREKQKIAQSVYMQTGFDENSEEIIVLRAIIKEFAESARSDNIIPVIYIVNSKNRGDHLFRALKPVLDANRIPHLSTHIICPPDDPRNYLTENSHFTPSKDLELAQAMIDIIEHEIRKKSRHEG